MDPTLPRPDRRSLWWLARGDQPPAAPTILPTDAEVVVVGAGLTGLSTALLLARAGRRPLALEARRVGAGTTGHSSAKVSLLQGSMLQRLTRHASPVAVRAYLEANRTGQAWLLDELRSAGTSVEERLAVTYAVTDRGAALVRREREASIAAGLPVQDVGQADLPFPVADAIGLPDQAQIDPLATLEVLRAELERLGGQVVEGVRVTGVSFSAPWTVTATIGGAGNPGSTVEIRAGHVVLATQVPILDRGLHFARLGANRSYVLAYRADPVGVPASMSLSLDDPARSLRTATIDGQHHLLVGGNGHRVGTQDPASRHVRELSDWARGHLGLTGPVASWSAQDYHLTTQLPSIGAVPGTDGHVLAATGFDKWGMATAAAAGHLLTGDITGELPAWAEDLRTGPPRLRDVTETAALVAGVAAHQVGDRAALAMPTSPGDQDTPPAEGEGRLEGNPLSPTAVSTVEGRTCRVSGVCPHLGGVLAWNDAELSWDCPLHGSRFAPDGTLLEGPATTDLVARPPR